MLTGTQAKSLPRIRTAKKFTGQQVAETRRLKKAMIDRDLNVSQVAEKIGASREATSKAINQLKFPNVLKKIKELLYDN